MWWLRIILENSIVEFWVFFRVCYEFYSGEVGFVEDDSFC